jgi:hypothetical protein
VVDQLLVGWDASPRNGGANGMYRVPNVNIAKPSVEEDLGSEEIEVEADLLVVAARPN